MPSSRRSQTLLQQLRFFGSPATMNLCSKCYRDIRLKEEEQAKTKSTIETALSGSSSATVAAVVPPPWDPPAPEARGVDRVQVQVRNTFCGSHRYPEKHACGFDFKAVGREEIARANPVIKARSYGGFNLRRWMIEAIRVS
ncbi:hypothetical protein JHK82_054100 [Glycine max]|nr:hypothetical protein JHK82_054100 [Glycine max]